jgi:uncharacterized protein (TIGR03437 family)
MTNIGVYSALFSLWPIVAAASTPVSTYGTYFGGTGDTNAAVAVAVDPSGNVVVVGYTTSLTLPGTANAYQPTKATGFADIRDIFLAKFDPTGRTLMWATFLGGNDDDMPNAVAVDSSGNVYVTGTTESTNFPVTPQAYLTTSPLPPSLNSFIAKVSADGSRLLYSTFLPFDAEEIGGLYRDRALAVNANGEAYIAGRFTASQTFVTPGALNIGDHPFASIFLARMNSTGTGLIFGADLGGGGFEGSAVTSLALDAIGNCYVAGVTAESTLPTTSRALGGQDPNAGLPGEDLGSLAAANSGFVLEVNPTGSQILYGTYFGIRYSTTSIAQIGIGSNGAIYFSGFTNGSTFQVGPSAFQITPASGFMAKFTPGSTTVDAFTYLPSLVEGGLPSVLFGNQPQTVYVSFPATGSQGFELAELDAQTLALVSSFTAPNTGFAPVSAALAPPHSVWFTGSAGLGLGSLISANSFQSAPQNPSSSAVLIQITDVSTNITAVVNAASYLGGPISPGEIVTIGGTELGPSTPAGLALDQTGKVATSVGGVQVVFDGTPAPLTYVSATQINCVVPYEVQGQAGSYVQVSYQSQTSSPFPLTYTAANPGLFTANGSGAGPAAAFNQDLSHNSPDNPAAKGSTVVLFMTGEGQTSPPGVTGGVTTVSATPPLTPQPLLPVTVLIGGQSAFVAFYGEAPGLVSGVMQLNVQIPTDASSGNLPVLVFVGASSQTGVTISVQ